MEPLLPPLHDPAICRAYVKHFGEEVVTVVEAIKQEFSVLELRSYQYLGPLVEKASLAPATDPLSFEIHRFRSRLRDRSLLILDIASAYVYRDKNKPPTAPIRYYRVAGQNKLNYVEGRLAVWPHFSRKFYHTCVSQEERRTFDRAEPPE